MNSKKDNYNSKRKASKVQNLDQIQPQKKQKNV